MSVWASRLEAMGSLENLLNRYAPRTPGKPVFAVIDTETTGFNKRYDRILNLLPCALTHTSIPSTPGTHCSTRTPTPCPLLGGTPPPTSALNPAVGVTRSEAS